MVNVDFCRLRRASVSVMDLRHEWGSRNPSIAARRAEWYPRSMLHVSDRHSTPSRDPVVVDWANARLPPVPAVSAWHARDLGAWFSRFELRLERDDSTMPMRLIVGRKAV